MIPRDTGTGDVLEQMALPALKKGGYDVTRQANVGERSATIISVLTGAV